MNYNDYRTYILTCEYLGKELTGKYKKIYDHFTGLLEGLEVVCNLESNSIVLQKGGQWYFKQDGRNGHLWCYYSGVWSFFRTDMGMVDTEIQDFIKSTVEEHLKCVVGTPISW